LGTATALLVEAALAAILLISVLAGVLAAARVQFGLRRAEGARSLAT
jgi:hypothetical protein